MKLNNDISNVVVSATQPVNKNKVWLQHSKNLLCPNYFIENQYADITGGAEQIGTNNSYWRTGRQKCSPSTTYYFNVNKLNYLCFYQQDGTPISVSYDVTTSFTTPANCYYIQISWAKSVVAWGSNVMVSITNGATYEAYVQDKEYILNTNNTYEEFTPQNEVYSTTETKIGTWYNGKPIYRKVYEIALALPTQVWTDSGITDISPSAIINAYTYYFASNTMAKFEVNANKTSDGKIQLMNLRNTDVYPTVIVLEYTKTTD